MIEKVPGKKPDTLITLNKNFMTFNFFYRLLLK